MDLSKINELPQTFKRGDIVEVDCHHLSTLSISQGTVSCVRSGKIYTDLLGAPFDQQTLMPRDSEGKPFAPGGKVLLLRHADDQYSPLPPIEVIAAMGLPNLAGWAAAIDDWNSDQD